MSKTVAILPGIVSGSHTTWRLQKLLGQAGYEIVEGSAEADIILAHSAGCLWLPKPTTARRQTVVLVNPLYWPGRTVRGRIQARSRSNAHFYRYGIPFRRWLARQWWGAYYVVRSPRRTCYVLRHMAAYDLEWTIGTPYAHIVVVRNQHDDWLTPDLTTLQRISPGLTLIQLPGEHDDFNYHPERYVALLQSLTENP